MSYDLTGTVTYFSFWKNVYKKLKRRLQINIRIQRETQPNN